MDWHCPQHVGRVMKMAGHKNFILVLILAIVGPVWVSYDLVSLIPESALEATEYEGTTYMLPVLMGILGFGFMKWILR